MLATAEHVTKAMNLTLPEVRWALAEGGFPDTDKEIIEAVFKGFNGAHFVYEITYPAPSDDCYTTGKIYVSLKRLAFARDYTFTATH